MIKLFDETAAGLFVVALLPILFLADSIRAFCEWGREETDAIRAGRTGGSPADCHRN